MSKPLRTPSPTREGEAIGASLFMLPALTTVGVLIPSQGWSWWWFIPVIGLGLMAAMEAGAQLAKPCQRINGVAPGPVTPLRRPGAS